MFMIYILMDLGALAVENASITVGRGASTASAKPKYRLLLPSIFRV